MKIYEPTFFIFFYFSSSKSFRRSYLSDLSPARSGETVQIEKDLGGESTQQAANW